MNWYKLIFFHIFKRYYKDGKFTNDIPWLTASVIVGISSSFYLLSLVVLSYFFFIDHNVPPLNKYPILICGFAFAVVNYLWFTYKKRYLKIYEEYRTSNKNNKVTAVLSWIYIIVGFASVPIVALIIHQ
jgi:Ca2+/Na+ antiporter